MSEYIKQAEDFAKKYNIKLKILSQEYKKYFNDQNERWVFQCQLKRYFIIKASNKHGEVIKGKKELKSYIFSFGQSTALESEEPSIYDILACLTKYDPEKFEDFCDNYGYDNDSMKAHKVYLNVCKEWRAVNRLFGDILDSLREIQ